MATTRIMPLHVGKGRTESRAISDIIDYVANPKKTDNGRLITGYACDSRTADAEFLLAKRQYIAATGRVRGTDDVIVYHVRQSFRPGEITPEEANRLGVEFAKRFTKGNHAFVVCTHIDKSHIHNHIIWSSVSLEYDRKFRNFWGSTKAVRRLSDTICIENGLSIVENPKLHGKSYNKWLGDQAKPSHREMLRVAIDNFDSTKKGSMFKSYDEELGIAKQLIRTIQYTIYGLLIVIGIIGYISLINTMITSILVRKKELGILQAIGLSDKQLRQMIHREGLFFTFGTLALSLTIGNGLGYLLVRIIINTQILTISQYEYPITQTLVLIVAVVIGQIAITVFVNRYIHKQSLVERMRD